MKDMYFIQTELWPYGDHKGASPMVTVVGYNTGRTVFGHSDYINYVYDRGIDRESITKAYDAWNQPPFEEGKLLEDYLPSGFIRVDIKGHYRQAGMTELIRKIMVEYEVQLDKIMSELD